jgi:hypothetical protein
MKWPTASPLHPHPIEAHVGTGDAAPKQRWKTTLAACYRQEEMGSPSSPPSARWDSTHPSRPPAPKARRPWYLVAALIGGWLFGAQGLVNGCSYISYYKDDRVQEIASEDSDHPSEERIRLEPFFHALDDTRSRVFPLSVAMLVLGGAMVMFAARAMGGRAQARRALVQVACVQALVCILFYVMTPEVRAAEGETWRAAGYGALFRRYTPPTLLALRTLASALMVLALTRPRARAFFDSTARGSV